jgi:hypothetical protein
MRGPSSGFSSRPVAGEIAPECSIVELTVIVRTDDARRGRQRWKLVPAPRRRPGKQDRRIGFAQDSPPEEAVSSEPVSEAEFPAGREFTVNFIKSGLGCGVNESKRAIEPGPYGPVPYASEQGIFCGLAGN